MSDGLSPRLEMGAGMGGQSCGLQKSAEIQCFSVHFGSRRWGGGTMCDLITPNMTQLLQRELTQDESIYMDPSSVSGA